MNEGVMFGRWLEQQRKAHDLTRAELAQRIGCAADTIYKIEKGLRRPSKQIAAALARCFAIPPEEHATFLQFARGIVGAPAPSSPAPGTGHPAPLPSSRSPSNIPWTPTPFIGRTAEVRAVRDLLQQADVRLVTLTGPGGIGKTRLGIFVARAVADQFPHGVFFVDLAAVDTPNQVTTAIAQTLGAEDGAGAPLEEYLTRFLSDKQLLVLLDNFEQVEAATSLIATLLEHAPLLKMLITSRAVLHVPGEHTFTVPPLRVPDLNDLPALEVLGLVPAVALFIAQAQITAPDFALTTENGPSIAAICARLEGIPLAIELAAARVGLLSPGAILARLSHRLSTLTGGLHHVPRRHQSLRAVFVWSYDLLPPDAQTLFARLGVFLGGCTLEAVEAIGSSVGDRTIDVLNGLTLLLDHHLLQQITGIDGERRFVMLETIREYALERLVLSGEEEALRRQYAAFYLALAEQIDMDDLRTSQQVDHLAAEYDNLRAVLRRGGPEIAMRMSVALGTFWMRRGSIAEGRQWLELVLANSAAVPQTIRAKALFHAGRLAKRQGDYDQARLRLDESLAQYRILEERRNLAETLNQLGNLAQETGDYIQAVALHEESLALKRELGDRAGVAASLVNLGVMAYNQGALEQARPYFEEALPLFQAVEHPSGVAVALMNLGLIALEEGAYARAHALLTEGRSLFQTIRAKRGSAIMLMLLGRVALGEKDYAHARTMLATSLAVFQELDSKLDIIENLELIAELAVAQDEPIPAIRLAGAVDDLRHALGMPRPPIDHARYERMIATARAQVDATTAAAAWAIGQALAFDQAIAEALTTTARSK